MITIDEDKDACTVTINGTMIDGFIDESSHSCGARRVYYDDFDAYFCPECNEWLEHVCSDALCSYCSNRPPSPLARRT